MKKEEVLKPWENFEIEKLDKIMTKTAKAMAKSYFKKEHKKLTPRQYELYMWEEYYAPYVDDDPRALPQKQEKKINKYKDWRNYEDRNKV